MKLILSYDEAQKVGLHIINMRPWIFENARFEDDGEKDNLHITFKERNKEE